jgi:hypothetical protein
MKERKGRREGGKERERKEGRKEGRKSHTINSEFLTFQKDNLFLVGQGFSLRLHTCKPGVLPLEPISSSFCSGYFGDGVSPAIC